MKIDLIEYIGVSGDKYVEGYVKVRCNDKFYATLKVIRKKDGHLMACIPSVKILDKWVKCFDFDDKLLTVALEKECSEIANKEHLKRSGSPSIHEAESSDSWF